jgi:Asp-tRNA(Asn)/Glu-tRNA(Gln) amidotransferase A subunit family amidase
MALHEVSAAEAVQAMRAGRLSAEELTVAYLDRIGALEPTVRAWAFTDADHALAQARAADALRRDGKVLGALHGVPVGVKDIFHTADMPTAYGSALYRDHRPERDATAVALLRQAGAVILGKTVTTEFAYYTPGETTNPHDATRTPGGSSSGSAAAVAAAMAPLALGSQTNGSVIRPASFCGVIGYKPTYGLISRHGMRRQSRALDQVGVFANTIEDAALLGDCLIGYDAHDPDMHPHVRPALFRGVLEDPPAPPLFAFVKTPAWSQAERDVQEGLAGLIEQLGGQVNELHLPEPFDQAIACHRVIMEADFAHSFEREYERSRDQLSPTLCEAIERGRRITVLEYQRALAQLPRLNAALDEIFYNYGTILTPAAPGEAPLGLASTGSPVFCTPWTLCGTPAVCLPLLSGTHGMPIGVQLVGARHDDTRLLRNARWLIEAVAAREVS